MMASAGLEQMRNELLIFDYLKKHKKTPQILLILNITQKNNCI